MSFAQRKRALPDSTIRVSLVFSILLLLLLDPTTARAVKLEIASTSTSSTNMSVRTLENSVVTGEDEWSSQAIDYGAASVSAMTWDSPANASMSIESLVQDAYPASGVRFIDQEIYRVRFNASCASAPVQYTDSDTGMTVTIPASFSSNLGLQCSITWTLAPTDAEQLGDPVIVSFEPVTYSVTADAGGVTLEHNISNWVFGVPGRTTFGPYEVTTGTELAPDWEGAEIHAYIGDALTFSYRAVSRATTQDGLAPSWFRAAWGANMIELGFRVRVFPAIIAPDVVGTTHLEAENSFAEAGFVAGLDIPTCSDTVLVGSVVAQDPPAETWVPYSLQGATLYLSGALVPNLVGMSEESVELPLINANLIKGRVTYSYEGATVPLGVVMAQNPSPAIFVPCGTPVDLVVSGGSGDGDGDNGDGDDGDDGDGGGGIPIQFDIKPNDCENRITIPWNAADKIQLAAAIIGWPDFDVRTIVTSSLLLEGAEPIRTAVADSASRTCDVEGPDGYPDLMMSFNAKDVYDALEAVPPSGVPVALRLTGQTDRDGAINDFEVEDFATFVFVGPPHPARP